MKHALSLLPRLFSRRWLPATLVVIIGMVVLARLGIWQLDRLEQRRASNAQLMVVLDSPPLDLSNTTLPDDATVLRNRQVVARGEYDYAHQMVLLVQNWQGRAGVHLITPLKLAGRQEAVLVDRGWIPNDEAVVDRASQFDEPGQVMVQGVIALPQHLPRQTTTSAAADWQREWYRVDVTAMQPSLPYPLLPIYIIQSPAPGDTELPFRQEPEIDLSEGPHLGYALQWFIFSLILGVGYLYFVHKETIAH